MIKFNLNTPIMNAMSLLADIILCNIMFCLFCLPLVTAGASLAALYRCMQYLIDDNDEEDEGNIVKKFWQALKENLGKGTVLWLLCLLFTGFLAAFYRVISGLEGMMGQVYRVSFFVFCFVFLVGFQYIFPMQARYENRVRDTLKNAWMLGVGALPWTLLSIALDGAAVYVSFFMNPAGVNMAVFVWAVGGFGVVAYINSLFFRQSFRRWRQDEQPVETEVQLPEEAVFVDERHEKKRDGNF